MVLRRALLQEEGAKRTRNEETPEEEGGEQWKRQRGIITEDK
jgi:hypothetical protein